MTLELVIALGVAALILGCGGIYALTSWQDRHGETPFEELKRGFIPSKEGDDPFIRARE